MTKRAPALSAEDRRATIVAAVLPLLLERGRNVTTRQMAEAACVAEGTIFAVFPDKEAVLTAVIEAALDPGPTEQALSSIDPCLPFEERLIAAVRILQDRVANIWRLVSIIGDAGIEPSAPADFVSLTKIFEAGRRQLRIEPLAAARQLRALTLAVSHPVLFVDAPMTPEQIVALLLDGIGKPGRRGQCQ